MYLLGTTHIRGGEISQGESMERGDVRPREVFRGEEHATAVSAKRLREDGQRGSQERKESWVTCRESTRTPDP